MNKKWLGSFLLLITAIVWGFCFVVQRSGMDYVGAFTYGAARFLLGGLALIPLALARPCEKQKRRKSLLAGLPCGLALFAGTSLQQLGLKTVSAGKAGFLSAMYIVLVPVLGLFIGQKVKARVWISAALGAVGLYLLCTGGADGSVSAGDLLVLGCSLMFAVQIQHRPEHLTVSDRGRAVGRRHALYRNADLDGRCRLPAAYPLRRPCLHRHRLYAADRSAKIHAAGRGLRHDVPGVGLRDALRLAGAG